MREQGRTEEDRRCLGQTPQRVRTEGTWEAWLAFFLNGVVEVATATTETTRQIVGMIERDRPRIQRLGRGAATAARVYDLAAR
jgi:hypothetical protein